MQGRRNIDEARRHHLPSAEDEHLTREVGRARCRCQNATELGAHRTVAAGLRERQLGMPDDRREIVVELVRDAAGKAPQRLELLCLPQLLLRRGQSVGAIHDGVGHLIERAGERSHFVIALDPRATSHVAARDGFRIARERFDRPHDARRHPVAQRQHHQTHRDAHEQVEQKLPTRRGIRFVDRNAHEHHPARFDRFGLAVQPLPLIDLAVNDRIRTWRRDIGLNAAPVGIAPGHPLVGIARAQQHGADGIERRQDRAFGQAARESHRFE